MIFMSNYRKKMDKFVNLVYNINKIFPRKEIFGITFQLK